MLRAAGIPTPQRCMLYLVFGCILGAAVPAFTMANTLSAEDMELILSCASLSNRVYGWDDDDGIGFDESFEAFYESEDKVDAVAVAVYPNDKCIVAFRGTKPIKENNVDGIIADITTAGIIDLVSNVAFSKEEVTSKTNKSASCTVGQPMLHSYLKMLHVEDQIDSDCVAQGLPLVFTGHSQGAALAQLAAVRYEQQQPRIINFGPMPAFFDDDECPTVHHDQVLNVINTETDKTRLDRDVPVQFDIIPFLDVVIKKYFSGFASSWSPLSDFFIGTYKGGCVILNPDDLPSSAYVTRREDILRDKNGNQNFFSFSAIDVDLLDLNEMLDFTTTTYGQRFVTAHQMNNYQRKLEQLHDKNPATAARALVADGFESFTSCNPGAGWKQCAGFCAEDALMCTTGAQGEPCSDQSDCSDSGLSCRWTAEGLFRLVKRCR